MNEGLPDGVVLRGLSWVVSCFWLGRRDRIGVRLALWHRVFHSTVGFWIFQQWEVKDE